MGWPGSMVWGWVSPRAAAPAAPPSRPPVTALPPVAKLPAAPSPAPIPAPLMARSVVDWPQAASRKARAEIVAMVRSMPHPFVMLYGPNARRARPVPRRRPTGPRVPLSGDRALVAEQAAGPAVLRQRGEPHDGLGTLLDRPRR